MKNFLKILSFVIMIGLIMVGLFYKSDRPYMNEEPEFTSWIVTVEVNGYGSDSNRILFKKEYITNKLEIKDRNVRFETIKGEHITVSLDSIKIEGTRL